MESETISTASVDKGQNELIIGSQPIEMESETISTASVDKGQNELIIDAQPIEMELEPNSIPSVGKTFNSMDEGYDFYFNYGGMKGFNVRKRSTYSAARGNEKTQLRMVFSREGDFKSRAKSGDNVINRNTNHQRSNCQAHCHVKRDRVTGLWVVYKFVDEHAHLLTSPTKRQKLKVNQNYSQAAKNLTTSFRDENIAVAKIPAFFGGVLNAPFSSRHCWNYVAKLREERNSGGDAEAVRKHFRDRAAADPYFYYAIDSDPDGRAVNFFWVDAHSRMAYNVFGDAVTFDTTYRTNKYCMPCGPFTGVNHHRQSILFGCCLIENEVEETFVWVFQKWLEAMGGKPPSCIITDQDQAMTRAVRRVFPNARHKYCMWHIKKKFGEKLGNVYFRRSSFKKELKHAIHNTWSHQDFEDEWNAVLVKFGLHEHEWLKDMFDIRHMWIPAFCRQSFSAGMKTKRSESMNSFFKEFFNSQTTLFGFVTGYEKTVAKIMRNEQDENWVSVDKDRSKGKNHHLLEHASKVYTRHIFDKFSKEFEHVYRLKAVQTAVDGEETCFTVTYLIGSKVEWYVRMNFASGVGSCTCCLFDFRGLPCKHLLHVFIHKYLTSIPVYFILKRWTKEATKSETSTGIVYYGIGANTADEAAYVTDFFKRSTRMCYMAAKSERGRAFFNESLSKAFEGLCKIEEQLLFEQHDNSAQSSYNQIHETATSMSSVPRFDATERVDALLLDPHISQTKGRKKSNVVWDEFVDTNKRIKGGMELSQRPAKTCSICHKKNRHNARTCPLRKKDQVTVKKTKINMKKAKIKMKKM